MEATNLDDWDAKLDLVCVRSREAALQVTFRTYEYGWLMATTTRDASEADRVTRKRFFTEHCFRDIPTRANPVPDSAMRLEVEIVTPAGSVRPSPGPIPPPPEGQRIEQTFGNYAALWRERLQPGETLTARTMNTDEGDPMILVFEEPEPGLVTFPAIPSQSDDDQGSHEAVVTHTNLHSVEYTAVIYVLSAWNGGDGVTDLELSFSSGRVVTRLRQEFGGRLLPLGMKAKEQLHVAPIPGGLRRYDCIVLDTRPCTTPLDCPPGYVAHAGWACSEPGTFGPAPHLLEDSASRRLVIAPILFPNPVPPARRLVRAMSNDVAMDPDPARGIFDRDPDGDGVGAVLERTVETCDSPSQQVGAFDCAVVWNLGDSDGDGLSDAWELFGVPAAETQDPAGNQGVPLPYFGADPRHKDMFLEIDERGTYKDSLSGCTPKTPPDPTDAACNEWKPRLTPCDAEHVASVYMSGGAADLLNPDGGDGVRLHFDLGAYATGPCRNSTRQPCVDDPSLCGDWGGSGKDVTQLYDPLTGVVRNSWEHETRVLAFTKRRWGIFRHAYNTGASASTGRGDMFGYPGTPQTLAHELGHTFGLQHHGVFDAGVANCKPHYVSIMNYLYMEEDRGQRFSSGEHLYNPVHPTRLFGLNSARLCEGFGIGPDTLPLFPTGEILREETFAGIYELLVEPEQTNTQVTQGGVDWNRDGVIEPSSIWPGCDTFGLDTSVSGFLEFAGGDKQCEQGHFRTFSPIVNESSFGPGAPALVRVPTRGLGVVFHDAGGGLSARFHGGNLNDCRDFLYCPAADPTEPPVPCTVSDACGDFDPPEVVLPHEAAIDLSRFAVAAGFGGATISVVAPAFLQADWPAPLHFIEVRYSTAEHRWIGSWQPIPDAIIAPTHQPVLVAYAGERHLFFWGDDHQLKHFRLDGSGNWVGEDLLVTDNFGARAVRVPPNMVDPDGKSVRVDPAATVAIEADGRGRMYLVVRAAMNPTLGGRSKLMRQLRRGRSS